MKRFVSALLTAALLLASLSVGAAAAGGDGSSTASPDDLSGKYGSFTGTVTDVAKVDGATLVMLENREKNQVHFTVDAKTVLLDGAKLEKGQTLTGFYDLSLFTIMIYPPRYRAVAVAPGGNDRNYFVGRFDDTLTSADNFLKLTGTDKAEITLWDGTPYTGSLENRLLAVVYTVATKSIPAQTNPEKIVLLPQKTDEYPDVSAMPIYVNGKKIDAPAAEYGNTGTVMVPLRAVAEALGYKVSWNASLKKAALGDYLYSVTIGAHSAVVFEKPDVTLWDAPYIKNSRTFVPLEFFRNALGIGAYAFEGQIDIGGELMQ